MMRRFGVLLMAGFVGAGWVLLFKDNLAGAFLAWTAAMLVVAFLMIFYRGG